MYSLFNTVQFDIPACKDGFVDTNNRITCLIKIHIISTCFSKSNMTTMCSVQYRHCIRHAVLLNNIGVKILENKCYGQALDTFQDALKVIKGVIHNSDDSTQSDCLLLLHSNASHRMANQRPFDQNVLNLDSIELCSDIRLLIMWTWSLMVPIVQE